MGTTIDVLGTAYTVEFKNAEEDELLKECNGYCDKTVKKIIVSTKDKDCDLGNYLIYQNKCLRHEVIHAFLFESGLHENWEHQSGHDETMVDWFAVQYPKIAIVFNALNCL